MKQIFVLTLVLCALNGHAEYEPKSPYLKDLSLNIEYIRNQADFFIPALDTIYGGFYCEIDRQGNITNNFKSILAMSQLAYAFSRAFMVTGDKIYLNLAHHALQFLYDYGWDQKNGGWYYVTDEEGNLPSIDPWGSGYNDYKAAWPQHFTLVGIAAICDATGGLIDWSQEISNSASRTDVKTDRDWLMAAENWLDEFMWDDRSGYEGYYFGTQLDGTNPWGKGYVPTVEGIPSHAITTYRLTQDARFKSRLVQSANIILKRLVAPMDDPDIKIAFPVFYDADWNLDLQAGYLNQVCWVLKTSLALAQIYAIDQDSDYKEAAQRLMLEIWRDCYDHENRVPNTVINWKTGEMDRFNKDFWTMDQAIFCGMVNYSIADPDSVKDISLQMADESIDFFMNYFVDKEYGGTYNVVNQDGSYVMDDGKGNNYKSGYQETELAYYTYLYGSLYYNGAHSVSLYYYFQAKDREQNFKLTPLAIQDENLIISGVTLDGTSFTNYDPNTRTITLAPGEGGTFHVTFKYLATSVKKAEKDNFVNRFELYQNYPNPFNSQTQIAFHLPTSTMIKVSIYNATGELVQVLYKGMKCVGDHRLTWQAQGLSSGIYLYKIESKEFTSTGKCLLLK
jgi:mannose/cellobiose epimerase-like protein (N-acyl-D-glucosamine 2-epimerase family)